jgi:hypothetical protein
VLTSLLSSAPQVAPTIVRIIKEPATKELTVVDLILSGLGLTGLILVIAVVIGGLLGALFIWFKSVRPMNPLNGQASQMHGLHLDSVSEAESEPR